MAHRVAIPINKDWHFKQADKDDASYLPVSRFPTQVHLDLLHHKLIPDPFLGKNELDVQWVGESAWTYRTTFATPQLDGRSKVMLAFEGLDTFATVVLNGRTILETDSMFIPSRVEVTGLLSQHVSVANELVITFESAFFRGRELVTQYPKHKWGCWNGDISRLAVRKSQYHWGWDWGPKLMTCGPWRPIHLEMYDSRIADLGVHVELDDSLKTAKVVAHASTEGPAAGVRFDISIRGAMVVSETVSISSSRAVTDFRVQKPELWYPRRFGKQPLYVLTATLLDGSNTKLDCLSKRIGLRKVELVQHPLKDKPGSSFFFRVNNLAIFSGGCNWIPADSFVTRLSRQRYYDWVNLAAQGNHSMIRVWGGGLYEEQALYDACDEVGILVWQDFLFACGNYPAYPDFLQSVEREARVNVMRLRHHPSIVIWAGNNEDYQYAESEGLQYNPRDMDPANWLRSDFPARYIYEKLLPDVCEDLIPDIPYHPGSPWGGSRTTDPTVGDIHQWNVWHGTQEKWQNFDKLSGRFVSEFGMEALPSVSTIDSFLPMGKTDPDRYAQSSTLDFHNKAVGHERRLAIYLAENFRYAMDPLDYHVYCTQLMQAECLSYAYRLWRREWKGPGREYCGGALVWQLNDCWPVTSWAICDYYLRPKPAYYAIKREMASVSIGIMRRDVGESENGPADRERRTTIEIWASNGSLDDLVADCVLSAWDLETGKQTFSNKIAAQKQFPANRSTEIATMDLPIATRNAGLEARTVVAAYLRRDGQQLARHVNWPEPFRHLHLPRPRRLNAELKEDGKAIQVSAEVPVKGLVVECAGAEVSFEDNLVDLVPGEVVRIEVKGAARTARITTKYLGMPNSCP